MTAEHLNESLEEIAAGWVARQRSGVMTEQEARDLDVWLDRDPAHREAFEHVQDIWRASAGLRTDPQIMVLRDAAMSAHPPRRRRWFAGAGIAAAVALAVFGGWGLLSPDTLPARSVMGAPQEQVFSTGLGQTATVTLGDGSVVTLDTNTRLRARDAADQRVVRLDRGQAFFRVAKDPSRPFVVAAGGKTITALGTAFNVRLERGRVEVILAEGRVKVSGAKPPPLLAPVAKEPPVADMTPGSRLVAAGTDDWRIVRVDVEAATSWRQGQLVFVRRPLGDVADELNRYSEKKIVVRDDGLSQAPITGGFAVGDVDAFVQAVEGYGLAYVASNTESAVVLQVY
jgi:transmembrane sensor